MYTVGLETDTRAYFTGVTILISLPTGTKIFNWLSTYLGSLPFLQLKTSSAFFGLLFLLMFTIGGSTGIILGNAAVDLGLHDTYYVVAHFHFVLSLGAVIAIFSGIIFIGEKIVASQILLPSSSSTLSLYHLVSTFIGILLTFSLRVRDEIEKDKLKLNDQRLSFFFFCLQSLSRRDHSLSLEVDYLLISPQGKVAKRRKEKSFATLVCRRLFGFFF